MGAEIDAGELVLRPVDRDVALACCRAARQRAWSSPPAIRRGSRSRR
jgi:hypothetical protein